jgi:hypothetical protein
MAAKRKHPQLPPRPEPDHDPHVQEEGPPPEHTEKDAKLAHGHGPQHPHDQPWIPKSGLVGRSRRSPRRQ